MPHVKLPVSHQNLHLYYDVFGEGPIKVLFIMGLRTEGRAWKYQTDFFSKLPNFQCVTFDNRGCGRSSTPFTLEYTTVQMAKDALALMDHLCWSRCHVVGVSMGGMISLELALLAPQRLLSLTLMATHAGGLIGQAPFIGIRMIVRSLVIGDERQLVSNALNMLYGPKTLNDPDKRQFFFNYHLERFKARVPLTMVGIFGQMFAVQRHYISYADLLKIRYSNFPCLIMVGTEDRLVREANSYMLKRTLGCRLVKLEDAGHDIGGERADQVNKELLGLFESTGSKETPSEMPIEYATEVRALELCCQHRTHCLVYNLVGLFKGILLGLILYFALASGLTKSELSGIDLCLRCVVLIGCLGGLRRSVVCVVNAWRARRYVLQHRLLLEKAASQGGVGIALPNRQKTGIPARCGFEFPLASMIFSTCLVGLAWWTRQTH